MDIKKDNEMYMTIAQIAAQRSYAKRLKVGCVIVKNHSIISFGWNGMPTGYDNCCEYEVDGKLVTRPEVQHAELNAIAKTCTERIQLQWRQNFYYALPLYSLLSINTEVRN